LCARQGGDLVKALPKLSLCIDSRPRAAYAIFQRRYRQIVAVVSLNDPIARNGHFPATIKKYCNAKVGQTRDFTSKRDVTPSAVLLVMIRTHGEANPNARTRKEKPGAAQLIPDSSNSHIRGLNNACTATRAHVIIKSQHSGHRTSVNFAVSFPRWQRA